MLIREEPAVELTVATRILARAGALAEGGRIAELVGSEVVYLAARGVSPHTMTPYDVAAVRLDGAALFGIPPDGTERYLKALRGHTGSRAAAVVSDGTLVVADSIRACVATLLRRPWEELEAEARASGALLGAGAAEP